MFVSSNHPPGPVPPPVVLARSDTDAIWETPSNVAVTVAVRSIEMVAVVAVKMALLTPGKTVTTAGTVRIDELLESSTLTPPEPAGCDNVTVHVDIPVEFRVAGLQDTALRFNVLPGVPELASYAPTVG